MSQESKKLYYQCQELLQTLQSGKKFNPLKDPSYWLKLQTFCKICKNLIKSDLDFALDKKCEIDLWNVGFKEVISYLQNETNTKSILLDKHKQNDSSITLKWFLDFAIGFYILLLQEITLLYDLDLPFLRSAAFYGVQQSLEEDQILPKKVTKSQNLSNVNYFCAHCLVHLGDIFRYKSQFKQACNFYKQSLKVAPASGHAYNQLALLEVSKGQNLNAIFYYIRALALKCPFPAASANLGKMYAKINDPKDFIGKFLLLQGLLHNASKLKKAVAIKSELCDQMTDLITSEILSTKELLQCIAILMFHLGSEKVCEATSDEEKLIYKLQVDLLAGFFSAFLMPVHTVQQGQALLDFIALPLVKLILDWIILNPNVLDQPGFLIRQQIWSSLAKMLNELNLQSKIEGHEDFPLFEDFDLQAFLPLSERFKNLNFRQIIKGQKLDTKTVTLLRARRIIEQGVVLASNDWKGRKVLIQKNGQFEAIEDTLPPEMLETLKSELNIKDEPEKEVLEAVMEVATKKTKNVAMAAILRGQQDQKSVSFKTPSPNLSEDSQVSQEDLKPSYMMPRQPPRPAQPSIQSLPMDFSVPPPPIPRPVAPQASPWPSYGAQPPRPVDPAAVVATFGGPSYSLFAGNNPSWSIGGGHQRPSGPPPPNLRPPLGQPPPPQGQNFMFQSGPSPLERLLQQNPRFSTNQK